MHRRSRTYESSVPLATVGPQSSCGEAPCGRLGDIVGPEHDKRSWSSGKKQGSTPTKHGPTTRHTLDRQSCTDWMDSRGAPTPFHLWPTCTDSWVANVVKVAIGSPARFCNAWISYMGTDEHKRSEVTIQKVKYPRRRWSSSPGEGSIPTVPWRHRRAQPKMRIRPLSCVAWSGSVRLRCRHQQFVCPNILHLPTVEQVVRKYRAVPPLSFSVRSSVFTVEQEE
jgi:hypothetical protein